MLASKLLILIGVSLQAGDSMAIEFRQSPLTKPAYCANDVGCFSPITKKVLPVGVDVYPIGICKKLTCGSDGYTVVHFCEKKLVPRGCHLTGERKQPYPRCCRKVVCPEPKDHGTSDQDYYDDGYVEDRPRRHRHRRYAPVKDYGDGRGDDYKLNEDKKILYDKKNETSRRAPWNKNVNDVAHNAAPEYHEDDNEGGRVDYYKPDNRGDAYKLNEDKKISYDNKNETSRRAPWNKNKDVDYGADNAAPEYNDDDDEGGRVDYYEPDNRGDDYKLQEDKTVVDDDKGETSRRAPWNKNKDVNNGVHSAAPEYRGDDYKRNEDQKILYDKKNETSRRAPWNKNKNVDFGAHNAAPEYNDDDDEGGRVDYYKPDNRGDDYKLQEDKTVIGDNKGESARSAPSDADPDDAVGSDDDRGDDYKLDEDQGVQSYDHKKVTSRRAPWNDNPTV